MKTSYKYSTSMTIRSNEQNKDIVTIDFRSNDIPTIGAVLVKLLSALEEINNEQKPARNISG